MAVVHSRSRSDARNDVATEYSRLGFGTTSDVTRCTLVSILVPLSYALPVTSVAEVMRCSVQ